LYVNIIAHIDVTVQNSIRAIHTEFCNVTSACCSQYCAVLRSSCTVLQWHCAVL